MRFTVSSDSSSRIISGPNRPGSSTGPHVPPLIASKNKIKASNSTSAAVTPPLDASAHTRANPTCCAAARARASSAPAAPTP